MLATLSRERLQVRLSLNLLQSHLRAQFTSIYEEAQLSFLISLRNYGKLLNMGLFCIDDVTSRQHFSGRKSPAELLLQKVCY